MAYFGASRPGSWLPQQQPTSREIRVRSLAIQATPQVRELTQDVDHRLRVCWLVKAVCAVLLFVVIIATKPDRLRMNPVDIFGLVSICVLLAVILTCVGVMGTCIMRRQAIVRREALRQLRAPGG